MTIDRSVVGWDWFDRLLERACESKNRIIRHNREY